MKNLADKLKPAVLSVEVSVGDINLSFNEASTANENTEGRSQELANQMYDAQTQKKLKEVADAKEETKQALKEQE